MSTMSGHHARSAREVAPGSGTVYRSAMVNNVEEPREPPKPPPVIGTAKPVPPAMPSPAGRPAHPDQPAPVEQPEPDGKGGAHRRPDAGTSKAIVEDLSETGAVVLGWTWSTQRQHTVLALLVLTIGVAPIALLPAESPIYAGIANITPTVHTYTLALIAALVVVAVREPGRFRAALVPWTPLAIWLLALTLTAWGATARTWSGVLQLSLGAGAFVVGRLWEGRDRRFGVLSWLFVAVAWIQVLAAALAAAGLPLRTITGPQALDIKGRATALTAHPGELAKLLFFCAVCILLRSQRRTWERWVVWSTLAAVFAGVFLSQSRTVLVAMVGLVGLSVVLEVVAARWQRRHLIIVGLTAVLGTASLPWLIARFSADPAGGDREHLLDVALETIGDHLWTGVGVNGYVAVVGATDRLTSTGVPVHSAVLLTVAELGIVGALALWLPLGMVTVHAVRHLWRSRGADPAARIVVSAMPGICLIAATGWGLMQGPYLLVLLLVTGYLGARVGAGDRGADDVH